MRHGEPKSGSKHLHVNREGRAIVKREQNAHRELPNTSQGFPDTSFTPLFLLNSILWPRDWDIYHRNTGDTEARLAVACQSIPYHLAQGLNLEGSRRILCDWTSPLDSLFLFFHCLLNLSLPLSSFSSFILVFLHHLLIVPLNAQVH